MMLCAISKEVMALLLNIKLIKNHFKVKERQDRRLAGLNFY